MAVFKDADQIYEILGEFFNNLKDNPDIGPKVIKSNLIIQFKYSDPDSVITIDSPNNKVICGDTDLKPDVEMSMKADVAHQFWLGNLNLMIALTKRQIVAKGPVPKIMKMLPIIGPAYAIYRNFLKEKGLEEMITD